MKRFNYRHGFTLVELLVVISIIGVLIAELLPAINSAREVARRSQCAHNLAALVGGVQSYEDSQGFYPPGVTDKAGPIQNRPRGMHHNWILRILPYIGERVAFQKVDFNASVYDKKNATIAAVPPPELLCPSDPDLRPHTSYAACHNDIEAPIDAKNHGVFFLNSKLRSSDISDGLAYTLFIAEKQYEPDQPDLGWMSGTRATLRNTGTAPDQTDTLHAVPAPAANPVGNGLPANQIVIPQPNNNPAGIDQPWTRTNLAANSALYVGGFGSEHGAGMVNSAFGDGSIRTVSDSIDMKLYRRLGNRADGELVDLQKLNH